MKKIILIWIGVVLISGPGGHFPAPSSAWSLTQDGDMEPSATEAPQDGDEQEDRSSGTDVMPGQTPANAGLEFMINQQYRHRDLRTLKFQFIQKRTSRLFSSDIYTTGSIQLLRDGGRLRYKIDSVTRASQPSARPIRSVAWHDGPSAVLYVPEAEIVYLFPARHDSNNLLPTLNYMLLGFFGRTDDVFNYYGVEEEPNVLDEKKTRLRFIPNYPWELGGLTLLRVDFDKETRYPERVYVEEARGDTTEIRINDVHVGMPDDDITKILAPDYPRDVNKIRM